MLTKRTQILFDQELFRKIEALAKEQNSSIGELTRQALRKVYFSGQDKIRKKREKAYKEILSFRKKYGSKYAKGKDSTLLIRRMRNERYGPKQK